MSYGSRRYFTYLSAAAVLLVAVPASSHAEETTQPNNSQKVLVYNDAGWELLQRNTAPQSIRDIERHSVDKIANSGVKIYQQCLLTGAVAAIHRSEILDPYASILKAPYKMHMWRVKETIRSLEEQGTDVLEIVIRRCRELGLEPHASFRVNDPHHTYYAGDGKNYDTAVKNRHEFIFPDLRTPWMESHRHLWLSNGGFDFSHEEVRTWKLSVVREVIDNYDIDGLELDFTRIRPFFQKAAQDERVGLMTAWVEEIRKMIDDKGRRREKPMKLTIRVEFDPAINLGEGLDVETWVKKGFIDMICLGVIGDATPDASADWFIKLCHGTKCLVCPAIEGFHYWYGKDLGAARTTSLETARAAAAAYYNAGADGIQLYNFCAVDQPWDRRIIDEIGNPNRLAFADKHYVFTLAPGTHWAKTSQWDSRFVLRHGETEKEFRFQIADDTARARDIDREPQGRLKLQIDALNRKDDIIVSLNGTPLKVRDEHENKFAWDSFSVDVVYYDVPGKALEQGENVLQLKRNRTYPGFEGHTEVQECELEIQYPGKVASSMLE